MMEKRSLMRYLNVFISIILIWYIASILLNLPIVPSPTKVFINLFSTFSTKIAVHSLYSLMRIFTGVIVSLVLGIPLGILIGYFKTVEKYLSPVIYFLYPIPKIALLPVVMLLFGLDEASKIIMIVIIVIFQIIVSTRDAVKNLSPGVYYSLYSLGATKMDIIREIVLPACLPAILSSIRIALGTALSILFFTETFGTEYGMGYLIMDSWMRVNYIDMYSSIAVLSFMGFFLFMIIDILEKLLCKWK